MHGQYYIVRTCFLGYSRKRPAQRLPTAHNLIHAATGFLGTSQPHEHLLQNRITTNAAPSFEILLFRNQHHPRIHKDKALIGTFHNDMSLRIYILVDNAIDECFSHGIVSRCLFLTHPVFHHERTWQGLYQPIIYPYIELIKVGFPQAVRIDTVCPPYIWTVSRYTFTIIHKIHRVARIVSNTVVFTEHQNTGQRESLFTGFIFRSVCS